jgi:hypothetical protein
MNIFLDHEDGEVVFHHACKLGLEGWYPSARLPYRSGRRPLILKRAPIGPNATRPRDIAAHGYEPTRRRLALPATKAIACCGGSAKTSSRRIPGN